MTADSTESSLIYTKSRNKIQQLESQTRYIQTTNTAREFKAQDN